MPSERQTTCGPPSPLRKPFGAVPPTRPVTDELKLSRHDRQRAIRQSGSGHRPQSLSHASPLQKKGAGLEHTQGPAPLDARHLSVPPSFLAQQATPYKRPHCFRQTGLRLTITDLCARCRGVSPAWPVRTPRPRSKTTRSSSRSPPSGPARQRYSCDPGRPTSSTAGRPARSATR